MTADTASETHGTLTSAPSDVDTRRLLMIYLDDHRAGAVAGVSVAKRFAGANSATPFADAAIELLRQIEEDAHTLDEIIERLDHHPSRWKMLAARAAELIGRVKSNGAFRRYSPLSRVLEIEMLSAGILTKESLWKSLGAVADNRPELDGINFDELQRRAQQQRLLLATHRHAAVSGALVGSRGRPTG